MMLLWPWAKLERRAVCAERCTYGSGRRSALALLTPLPMARGFVYLASSSTGRAVRSCRGGCRSRWKSPSASCPGRGAGTHGRPKIFNTDQGSQFTSTAFTGVLVAAGIAISIDGRGRWIDNVFIERLWRSLKHEDIYLKGYADGGEARAAALRHRPRVFYGLPLHRGHRVTAKAAVRLAYADRQIVTRVGLGTRDCPLRVGDVDEFAQRTGGRCARLSVCPGRS